MKALASFSGFDRSFWWSQLRERLKKPPATFRFYRSFWWLVDFYFNAVTFPMLALDKIQTTSSFRDTPWPLASLLRSKKLASLVEKALYRRSVEHFVLGKNCQVVERVLLSTTWRVFEKMLVGVTKRYRYFKKHHNI